jgi:hypothetical protein
MPTVKLPEGWLRYEPTADVIDVDVTGVKADTVEVIDEIFDRIEALARRYPGRYVLACWTKTEIQGASVVAHYGQRTARLLTHVKQVLRYAADDPITRSIVRTEAIRHVAAGVRSNLYATRADALAYVLEQRGAERLETSARVDDRTAKRGRA